jgi:hypothetical protein
MSPDGRVIAFNARDGICLFDWRSREFRVVLNPPDSYFQTPMFSPDGGSLVVAVKANRIAIIDVATLQVGQVFDASEKYEWIAGPPVFQPGTGRILYVAEGPGVWQHFRLLDPTNGTARTLMDARKGFFAILKPSFVADDEVIFAGMGPQDSDLKREVDSYLLHPISDSLTYRFRPDDRSETTKPEIYEHSLRTAPQTSGVSNLAASRGGETIVYIDLSVTDPNLKGKFNYEIFKLENGTITQMTNLRSHMARLAIAYDGSTAVFGSDPTRSHAWDLFILDLRTGALHQTDLLARMLAHPECVER